MPSCVDDEERWVNIRVLGSMHDEKRLGLGVDVEDRTGQPYIG